MKKLDFNIPIYYAKVTLIITDDYKEIERLYDVKVGDRPYEGFSFDVEGEDEYVIVISNINWSIISHEVVHVVNMIFSQCHIELDLKNDEPQAYLTGYIIKQIEGFLKENNNNGN